MIRSVYPLYGANTVARAVGFQDWNQPQSWPAKSFTFGVFAEGIECVLPSIGDWRYLQPSEATDPEGVWDPAEHLPWPSIIITPKLDGFDETYEDNTIANAAAADSVRALRLLRRGWFLDPALGECIHDDGKGRLRRRMGPYRLTYHDEDIQRPAPIEEYYQIRSEDFVQPKPPSSKNSHVIGVFGGAEKPGLTTRLQRLFAVLQQHRCNSVASAEVALEAFNRCHGINLSAAQRTTMLTIAIETILGPWAGTGAIVPSSLRLEAALSLICSPTDSGIARWFDSDVRPLRNAAAHGRVIAGEEQKETIKRLMDVVRMLVLQYLVFSRRWLNAGVREDKVVPKESCTTAFNRSLSAVATNGATVEDARLLSDIDGSVH